MASPVGKHRVCRLHRNGFDAPPTPRRARTARRGVISATTALLLLAAVAPAVAVSAPQLRAALRKASLLGIGHVVGVSESDFGRVQIVDVVLEKQLKPVAPENYTPRTVRVVSITDQAGAARVEEGQHGALFLSPLQRNTYLNEHVGTEDAFRFVAGRESWLTAPADQLPLITRPISYLVESASARKKHKNNESRGSRERKFVFSLIKAPHPLLVSDGIASLSSLPALAEALTDDEIATMGAVLNNTDLPLATRERLISEITTNKLRKMINTLRSVKDPNLQHHAWVALRKLGVPPEQAFLEEQLDNDTPAIRIAAVRELLSEGTAEAVHSVSRKALHDESREVRLETIKALGESGIDDAVVPLEKTFVINDLETRQASARALIALGGDSAADALFRLSFVGPLESQRFAVIALLSLGVGHDDARVRNIKKRHSDEKITEILEHGLTLGHSH